MNFRSLIRIAPAALFAAMTLSPAFGEEAKPVTGKIASVTVYQQTALVTREIPVPEGSGLIEVVVSPLPPSTMSTSIYAEGSDGARVLSARYRTRAIAEDSREEVRKLEAKLKDLQKKSQLLAADIKTLEQNAQFMTKLEGFTAATLVTLTDKGHLDSEKTIAMANFIRDSRTKSIKDEVTLRQQLDSVNEDSAYTQRELQEKAGGRTRTERDAVIVIDKTKAGAGTVRLNYLVEHAGWKPQYKLRASAKDKDQVIVEYLASVVQQTDEDWSGVDLILSTAQPLLNAAPPDLHTLEIAVHGVNVASANGQPNNADYQDSYKEGQGKESAGRVDKLRELKEQSQSLRKSAQEHLNSKKTDSGGHYANQAAAIEQYRDLLVSRDEVEKGAGEGVEGGPSVAYHLKTKLSLPSRYDDQVLEIAKLELVPKFYFKAVPILTPNVYRIADLTNTTDYVFLPGDAVMYLGTDFVGQTQMPLVAIGKPFTVGFGADPQLQIQRKLLDKTRTLQGGNQVLNFKYRILINSYKSGTVDVQVWDRLPHAEAQQTIAVSILKGESDLSKDPLYVRDDRPKNLLRWDLQVKPSQNGEKALTVDYEYKLEFEKAVNIGAFMTK